MNGRSDSEQKGGIFTLFRKLKIRGRFAKETNILEYLRSISFSVLSGIVAGIYVQSSVSYIGGITFFAVSIPTILVMVWILDFIGEMGTKSSKELQKEIMELLRESELELNDIISKLDDSPEKINYNLKELTEQGKIVGPF